MTDVKQYAMHLAEEKVEVIDILTQNSLLPNELEEITLALYEMFMDGYNLNADL